MISPEELLGKTDYELWPEHADELRENDLKVMSTGCTIKTEETVTLPNGKKMYFAAEKMPLRDAHNNIIGVIGNSTDITELKETKAALATAKEAAELALKTMQEAKIEEQKHREEAERLTIENAKNRAELEAQAKFTRLVSQVYHDINSPLSSLVTLQKLLANLPPITNNEARIPEHLRTTFSTLLNKAIDIVNTLTTRGANKTEANPDEVKKVILLSALLMQSLGEKSLEYTHKKIQFNREFKPESEFIFVSAQVSQLSRALSNLINNAVDAVDAKSAIVTIKLDVDNDHVHIIIQDNGKGMSKKNVDRIMNHEAFTEGKENGHGIGYGQVHDALARNNGTIHIESILDKGTQVTLSFPKEKPPIWAIDTIDVTPTDIIVILDDDESIHWTWDTVFKPVIEKEQSIRLIHFQEGDKAIDFIQSLSEDDKKRLLLLSDLELLNQKRTGLDVIKIVNIKRAVLVTSHYNESDTQKEIIRLGAKLLPKQLANSISIRVSHQQESCPNNELHTVSAIWLDDDPSITDLNCQLMAPLIIDVFRSPLEMMNIIEMRNYPKDIPIFLDNNFEGFPEVTGIDIAIKLHQLGFTKLRLLSGQDLGASDISPPEYLIIIPKYAASELDQYF